MQIFVQKARIGVRVVTLTPILGLFNGGRIKIYRHDNQYRHQNVTEPGHLFHPGEIDRYA
jgi:hypothetical protein